MSQLNATPVPSRARRVASMISGPVPSPGIRVTSYAIAEYLSWPRHPGGAAGRLLQPRLECVRLLAESRRQTIAKLGQPLGLVLGLGAPFVAIDRQQRLNLP